MREKNYNQVEKDPGTGSFPLREILAPMMGLLKHLLSTFHCQVLCWEVRSPQQDKTGVMLVLR